MRAERPIIAVYWPLNPMNMAGIGLVSTCSTVLFRDSLNIPRFVDHNLSLVASLHVADSP